MTETGRENDGFFFYSCQLCGCEMVGRWDNLPGGLPVPSTGCSFPSALLERPDGLISSFCTLGILTLAGGVALSPHSRWAVPLIFALHLGNKPKQETLLALQHPVLSSLWGTGSKHLKFCVAKEPSSCIRSEMFHLCQQTSPGEGLVAVAAGPRECAPAQFCTAILLNIL